MKVTPLLRVDCWPYQCFIAKVSQESAFSKHSSLFAWNESKEEEKIEALEYTWACYC